MAEQKTNRTDAVTSADTPLDSENIFNLDSNTFQLNLERFTQNTDQINTIVAQHISNIGVLTKSGQQENWIMNRHYHSFWLIGKDDAFPGTLYPHLLIGHNIDPSLAEHIAQRVNANPSLVFEVPEIIPPPSVVNAQEPQSLWRPRLAQAPLMWINRMRRRGQLGASPSPEILSETQPTPEPESPDVLKMRAVLDIQGPLSQNDAESISKVLQSSKDLTQEVVYCHFMLSQAQTLITAVAPRLAPYLEKVKKNYVFARSLEPDQITASYWAATRIQNIDVLFYQKESAPFIMDEYEVKRLVIIIHEMLHSVMFQIFHEFFSENSLYETKFPANALDTLLEGVSLAFELEIIKKLRQNSTNTKTISILDEYLSERMKYLRQSNQQIQKVRNKKSAREFIKQILAKNFPDGNYPEGSEQLPQPRNFAATSYSDGFRLAIRLSKNGWTLNDLPDLVLKIKEAVDQVTNDKKETLSSKLNNIPLNRHGNSHYQKLYWIISHLKKP